MRWKRDGSNPAPEPTWIWRPRIIFGIVLVVLAFLAITSYMAFSHPTPDQVKIKDPAEMMWDSGDIEYETPKDPPASAVDPVFVESANRAQETAGHPVEPPLNEAIAAARKSGIVIAAASDTGLDGTGFASSSGGCRLPAGTIIQAWQETAATNTNPGTVLARVRHSVLGEDSCDGIRAGAVFVGSVEQGADFRQNRANYVFTTLEPGNGKPAIDLQLAAGDAMGAGGVPGDVDHHTGLIASRVAIASVVGIADAGAAQMTNLFGIPVQQTSRAVDQWADQAINLDPTLTTNPAERRVPITIILTKGIVL